MSFRKYVSLSFLCCQLTLSNLECSNSSPALAQISPTTPDTILDLPTFANLESLMTNNFNSPFYPLWPNLSRVVGQFNSYLSGSSIIFNPTDDRFMLLSINQDRFRDRSATYLRFSGTVVTALSSDRGKTWDYTNIALPIGLGGTISQQVFLGGLSYSKCGDVVYASGDFNDMHVNPPFTAPMSGGVFSRSFDNGRTWSTPIILGTGVSGAFINGAATGFSFRIQGILADPAKNNLIHANAVSTFFPTTFYGNVFYIRSEDQGGSWTTPIEVYNMVNDPVWVSQHADNNFSPLGGQSLAIGRPVSVDDNILLLPMLRIYPKPSSPIYTQEPTNSDSDRAVVRSLDNGKTWNPIAGATENFIVAFSHDPSQGIAFNIILNDGTLNTPVVVSPYTGRLYMAFQAGNTKVSNNPNIIQGYPYIALVVSNDQGMTWSPLIQINQTPTNISFDAQQAFNPNLIFTKDGSLVVVYNDFRNFAGGTVLSCNAWMDIFRETSEPHGGSTGVGLDFVKEIQLTPTFDAAIGLRSNLQGIGGVIGLGLSKNNEVFFSTNITNQNNIPPFIGFNGMTIDVNNRTNVFLGKVKFPNQSNR